MSEAPLSQRLAELSPEKRRLLELRRRERAASRRPPGRATEPPSAAFSLISDEDRRRLPPGLEDAFPLSTVQLGMIYHMEATADLPTPAYHNVNSFHLRAPFKETAFRQAIQEVVDRHPMLRTSFDLTTCTVPMQLVHRRAGLRLTVADIRHLGPAEQRQHVLRFSERELSRLVDLTRPSLVSLHVLLRTAETFQLVLVEPHAIADGWSTNTTLAEIFRRYLALLRGEPLPIQPPPAVTVRDFVRLEQQALRSPENRRFWAGEVAGATVLELPRWRAAEDLVSSSFERKVHAYPTLEQVAALRRLGRLAAVPFKSVLLAAHLKVMSLASGRRDVTTGLTLHGRPEAAEATELRGMFLTTLPLRLVLAQRRWIDLVQDTFRKETEIWAHRHYPLAAIQQQVGKKLLFDTAFGFLNFHSVQPVFESGEVEIFRFGNLELSVPHFVLSTVFSLEPIPPHRLRLCLELDDRRLTRAQGRAILATYLRVLAAMAADPDGDPGAAAGLAPPELHLVQREWNDTRTSALPAAWLDGYARQAARRPGALAVAGGGEALTYAQLDERSNRLARHLEGSGLGPEDVAGIFLERSPSMVVALLAVHKTGGAYLPLDPGYPDERLRYMLEDSGAALLVTESALGERLAGPGVRTVWLDREAAQIRSRSPAPVALALAGEALAYVLYTSGSTGRPKGVMVSHGALANLLAATGERVGLAVGDRLLAVTPLSFDISGLELYLPLTVGAAVLVAEREVAADAHRLLERLPEATVMQATPATWRALVDAGWQGTPGLKALCGGEALPPGLAGELGARAAQLWNVYGPTETTIWSTCERVVPGPRAEPQITLGRPLAATETVIVDELLLPLAPGVPGELVIGGAGLARGYRGRPALTAERFVPSPLGARGGRLYRTGDLARALPDGRLEFLGRLDHQVKVRGFRIELGEIETVLAAHPAVAEAVVVGGSDGEGEARLVAYHRPRSGQAADAVSLRAHLAQSLPPYMVPSAFVALAAFPRTPAGKVDRKALPAPEELAAPERELRRPATPTEEVVAGLAETILGRRPVALDADFFELGGDSISATRLVSQLRKAFGVEINLADVLSARTLEALARRLDDRLRGGEVAAPPLVPVDRAGELPLSFAQERLWFVDQLKAGESAFNIALGVRLEGRLLARTLAASFSRLAERHEVLRTRFAEDGGRPQQVIARTAPVAPSWIDLAALPPGPLAGEADRLAAAEAERPFDLARGPIWRQRLLRLAADSHLALVTVHHVASDAWSRGILVREIAELYTAGSEGRPPRLPALPIQYADFAHWQRRFLTGEGLSGLLAYWRRRLAGLGEPPALPLDRPRTAATSARGALLPFRFGGEAFGRLAALARAEGATVFMVLLAAFKALLHRVSLARDVVVGTDIANRNRAETENLIGFFVNLLVLRTDLGGNPTFRALLARVRETTLGAFAHEDLPLAKLVEELKPPRQPGRSPLFDALFVLQNAPQPSLTLPGLTLQPVRPPEERARFDLALFVEPQAEGLRGSWSYRVDLFDRATVERLAERFSALLADAVLHPERRLDELAFATAEEEAAREARLAASSADRRRRFQAIKPQPIHLAAVAAGSAARREDADSSPTETVKESTVEPQKTTFSKFRRVEPKAVSLPRGELVREGFLPGSEPFPLVLEPSVEDLDLAAWAGANRDLVEEKLGRHGAILFRGFRVPTVEAFESFAASVCPVLYGDYGDLPPAADGKKVYNSTPYPPDKTILFHNESSHTHQWPLKQFFCCLKAAASGGETPIVDCRRVFARLDPALRDRFASLGLLYVRNFTPGLDVRWQDFFHTDERAEVEAYCRDNAIEVEWEGDQLRMRQRGPAVARHPKTGELVFFNQIQLHHTACMEPETRESLLQLFREQDLPRNVYFGDGSPIEDGVVQEILDLYWRESVAFPWREGDVILLDNMLVAHARNPYGGERRIAVAMGDMFRRADLE